MPSVEIDDDVVDDDVGWYYTACCVIFHLLLDTMSSLLYLHSITTRVMSYPNVVPPTVSWLLSRKALFSSSETATTPTSRVEPSVKLYQYQICPFCNYSKAALNYANVPYEYIEVNPLTKAEIKWSKDYRKVPIAMFKENHDTLEEQRNGSEEIVAGLLENPAVVARLQSQKWKTMTLETFQHSASAKKWTAFAKDDLAPLLYPNLCASLGDSFRAFSYVHTVDSFSALERLSIQTIGSFAMYMAASKIKRKNY
jgi:microsomal prostaglandin-E synthase 2